MAKKIIKPPEKPVREAPFIQIGASPKAIAEARTAINDILASPSATEAKVAAFGALGQLCNVNGTSVANCHFQP